MSVRPEGSNFWLRTHEFMTRWQVFRVMLPSVTQSIVITQSRSYNIRYTLVWQNSRCALKGFNEPVVVFIAKDSLLGTTVYVSGTCWRVRLRNVKDSTKDTCLHLLFGRNDINVSITLYVRVNWAVT